MDRPGAGNVEAVENGEKHDEVRAMVLRGAGEPLAVREGSRGRHGVQRVANHEVARLAAYQPRQSRR